jgi:hypothetical protein
MAEYNGTMTEVKRFDTKGPSVIVSYWTNDEGEKYEPRVRFTVGERNRPVKGLTKDQALAVRDAFNAICDDWPGEGAPRKAKPTRRTSKKASEKESAPAIKATDATAQITELFKNRAN